MRVARVKVRSSAPSSRPASRSASTSTKSASVSRSLKSFAAPPIRNNVYSSKRSFSTAGPKPAIAEKVTKNENPHALAKELSGKHFYDGAFQKPKSGQFFDVKFPATKEKIADAALGDSADVDAAVKAAYAAQKEWAKVPTRQRGQLLQQCGTVLKEHTEEIAKLIALETGKALRTESRVEAGVLSDAFTFFGGLTPEIKGETIPWSETSLTMTLREPVGVVGAIIPWNVPLLLMALKIAPAIATGNTVVVKSAEEAPLAVLRVCQILNTVLPKGVFNMLSGMGPECGAPLVSHPKVKKVTFTGSVETGKIVYGLAAQKLIPVTLELGGKSPMIILEDADLEKAVAGAITSMRFTRAGQSCTAASRIFVHESIHDNFVKQLCASVNKLKMGHPLDEKTDIGTIISDQQFKRVQDYIKIGTDAGGKANICSEMPAEKELSKGLFTRPVIFTNIKNTDRIAREEIFGPVTCVMKFKDFDEVINMANDTEFGLSASLWTRDLQRALSGAKRLEAGIVQVNQNAVIQPNLPVGGWKNSGLGREASLDTMLEHFTHKKTVSLNMA